MRSLAESILSGRRSMIDKNINEIKCYQEIETSLKGLVGANPKTAEVYATNIRQALSRLGIINDTDWKFEVMIRKAPKGLESSSGTFKLSPKRSLGYARGLWGDSWIHIMFRKNSSTFRVYNNFKEVPGLEYVFDEIETRLMEYCPSLLRSRYGNCFEFEYIKK